MEITIRSKEDTKIMLLLDEETLTTPQILEMVEEGLKSINRLKGGN